MYLGKLWRKEGKKASVRKLEKNEEEQGMNMSNEKSSLLKAIWSWAPINSACIYLPLSVKSFGNNGFIRQPAQSEFDSRKEDGHREKGVRDRTKRQKSSTGDREVRQAETAMPLHCVESNSSWGDAHGKGGMSTFIVTKMSYCLFTRETKVRQTA